eukprot:TRINITY_DN5070_c0_g1_i2.p1 TRINITY_DN5070_c0_g1~~TRINITY_DN5070_c0_g1_i2.p1  ORF type:complete len:495 (+),score=139.87 TRINITY_DN5070_c0_g1_i2:309-1793(+)
MPPEAACALFYGPEVARAVREVLRTRLPVALAWLSGAEEEDALSLAEQLTQFYLALNPGKVSTVGGIAARWGPSEHRALQHSLMLKYFPLAHGWRVLSSARSDVTVLRLGRSKVPVLVIENVLPPDQLQAVIEQARSEKYIQYRFDFQQPLDSPRLDAQHRLLQPLWPQHSEWSGFPGLKSGALYPNKQRSSYPSMLQTHLNAALHSFGELYPDSDWADFQVSFTPKKGAPLLDELRSFFGLVALDPDYLRPGMKVPHYDTAQESPGDGGSGALGGVKLAAVHYLQVPGQQQQQQQHPGSGGTGMYRERASGIERLTAHSCLRRVSPGPAGSSQMRVNSSLCTIGYGPGAVGWAEEHAAHTHMRGYPSTGCTRYELLEAVPPKVNRVVLFPQSQLHNAFLDAAAVDALHADPTKARLTANSFVQGVVSSAVYDHTEPALNEFELEGARQLVQRATGQGQSHASPDGAAAGEQPVGGEEEEDDEYEDYLSLHGGL